MTDLRPVLERLRDRIPPPPGGLERLILYREGRRRRRRIGTIGMALILGVAGTLVAVRAFAPHDRSKPAGLLQHGAISFVRGTILAGASIPDAEIYLMEPDGSGVRKLTDAAAEGKVAAEPAWSPDGARIAFVLSTPEHLGAYAGDGDVYVMNSDGTGLTKLTDGLRDAHPAWSPEGDRIVFVRDQGNSLFVMNADGSGAAEIRLHGQAFPPYQGPAWSPDGTQIAFQASPSAGVDTNGVYVTDVDGNGTARVTPGSSDGSPAWSPDGTTLAYAGSDGIYLHDMQTGTDLRLTNCGKPENCGFDFEPSWAPDGSRIVFARQDYGGTSVQIFVVNADGTGLQQLTSGPEWNAEPIWQPLPADAPTPSPIEAEGRVTATIPISAIPNSVLVADGSVWVSGRLETAGHGDLVRLDPTTGEVLARIPMQGLPSWEVGGGGMTAGLGSIWVLGNDQRGTILQRVDPASNRLVDVIPILPDTNDADVWVDETGIWVLMFSRHDPGLQVVVVDPSSYEIGQTIPIAATWAHWIFGAGGSIWVLGNAPNSKGPIEIDTLYRIDPSTGTVTTVTLPGYAWKPVVAGDTVWLEAGDDHVVELDATTGTLGQPIQVRLVCCSGPFVGDGAGGIWVASVYDGHEATFAHVSSLGTGDAVGAIPPDQVQDWSGVDSAFDPVTGSLWVVHYRDSMSRIEISDSSDGLPSPSDAPSLA